MQSSHALSVVIWLAAFDNKKTYCSLVLLFSTTMETELSVLAFKACVQPLVLNVCLILSSYLFRGFLSQARNSYTSEVVAIKKMSYNGKQTTEVSLRPQALKKEISINHY